MSNKHLKLNTSIFKSSPPSHSSILKKMAIPFFGAQAQKILELLLTRVFLSQFTSNPIKSPTSFSFKVIWLAISQTSGLSQHPL
jgi:hypothetical protein